MKKSVVVFAAHPDDEVLGCGGAIAHHSASGHSVHVVIAAEGITSRQNQSLAEIKKELEKLRSQCIDANKILGAATVDFLEFPDNAMDSITILEITKKIEVVMEKYSPEIIYTHHSNDLNIDHELLNRAVLTAARPLPGSSVKEILFFETLSATGWYPSHSAKQFFPNSYLNIDKFLEAKVRALKRYASEMRDFPHARSIETVEHLAKLRGSEVGMHTAEAFYQARRLI